MSESDGINSGLREDIGEDIDIHDTRDPDAIFVTSREKIELALINYEKGVKAKLRWATPATLAITVLSVLFVTDFTMVLGMSADFWRATFSVIFVLSIIWTIYTIAIFIRNQSQADKEFVIDELRSDD